MSCAPCRAHDSRAPGKHSTYVCRFQCWSAPCCAHVCAEPRLLVWVFEGCRVAGLRNYAKLLKKEPACNDEFNAGSMQVGIERSTCVDRWLWNEPYVQLAVRTSDTISATPPPSIRRCSKPCMWGNKVEQCCHYPQHHRPDKKTTQAVNNQPLHKSFTKETRRHRASK